jgi:hypothetical protein
VSGWRYALVPVPWFTCLAIILAIPGNQGVWAVLAGALGMIGSMCVFTAVREDDYRHRL